MKRRGPNWNCRFFSPDFCSRVNLTLLQSLLNASRSSSESPQSRLMGVFLGKAENRDLEFANGLFDLSRLLGVMLGKPKIAI